jgi:CheY-like chemotaxis protein
MRELGYKGPIIGVTGNALPSDVEYFMSSGANAVLAKPLQIAQLRETIAAHCNAKNE